MVDGLAWPKGSLAKYGWQRFLKYRIGPNFYGATQFVVINLDKYNKLSKAHKNLLAKQAQFTKIPAMPCSRINSSSTSRSW